MDKNELSKKKKPSSASEKSAVFITRDYCDQNMILLSKNQSLGENVHLHDDNHRVSF